ncbi:hypothetical protein HK100_008090, partial [Physocladia obscura]
MASANKSQYGLFRRSVIAKCAHKIQDAAKTWEILAKQFLDIDDQSVWWLKQMENLCDESAK